MLGRDLLVAPVVKEGMREREVYFPTGDSWIDWWTGERFAGGKAVTVKAPLDRLPLFARVGSIIPSQPVIQNTGEMSAVPISLTIVGGIANGANDISTLFQDAGDGYGYQSTQWREFRFETRQGLLKITRIGNFAGQAIKNIEIIGLTSRPRELHVDGRVVEFAFDETKKRLTASIPENAADISLSR